MIEINLAVRATKLFPTGHLEEINQNKVRLEFTEAECAEIEYFPAIGVIVIRCTCPALRDDFWMDSFGMRGYRDDTNETWNVTLKKEDFYLTED